jgi:hypothetical protein
MVTAETHELGKADGQQWEPLDCGMQRQKPTKPVRIALLAASLRLATLATTRAGVAQRAIPAIPLNAYRGVAPNFRCPYGTFCGDWPKRVVEPEGVMKLLTVRF